MCRGGQSRERSCNRPHEGAERYRLSRLRSRRRLVAPFATLHPMRPNRMLRQLPEPARDRPRSRKRPPDHCELRAGRSLVLRLPKRRVSYRPPARPSDASSSGPTRAGTERACPQRLGDAAPPLIPRWSRRMAIRVSVVGDPQFSELGDEGREPRNHLL
jgi:hypothetical protein